MKYKNNKKLFNGLKHKIIKYIFVVACFFATNFCSAEYHSVNLDGSELSTTTASGTVTSSIENQLLFPDSGQLGKDLSGVDDEDFSVNKLFDFGGIYFWVMMISLFLVLMILANVFRKLSQMKEVVKDYRKNLFVDNEKQREDEIIESNEDQIQKELEDDIKYDIKKEEQVEKINSDLKTTVKDIDDKDEIIYN